MKCKTRCVYTKLDFETWTIECKNCNNKVPLHNASWWQYGGSIYIDGKLKKKANKKWFHVSIGSPDYVSDIAAYEGKPVEKKVVCDRKPMELPKLTGFDAWKEGGMKAPDSWLAPKELKKKSKHNNLIP